MYKKKYKNGEKVVFVSCDFTFQGFGERLLRAFLDKVQ